MKQKFTLIILCQLIFSWNTYAQIPNPDFENWNFFGWFANPDEWNTNNMQITSSVVKPDSDAYTGVYSMQLYNYGTLKPVAWTQFALATNISAVTAYVKLNPVTDDTVSIKVREFYNGILVDSGEWKGYTYIAGYTPVTVAVSQNNNNIDTVEIEISGGNHTNVVMTGTEFKVDHLQLVLSTGIFECPVFFFSAAYPNPIRDVLFIRMYNSEGLTEIKIFNSLGSEVKKISVPQTESLSIAMQPPYPYGIVKIDVSDLASGNYFILAKSNTTSKVYKCIKQ